MRLSSISLMYDNRCECNEVRVMKRVCTEESLEMLRPRLEFDFMRLTKISTCVRILAANSSICTSSALLTCRGIICWGCGVGGMGLGAEGLAMDDDSLILRCSQ